MTAPKILREVTRVEGEIAYVYSFCAACRYWHAFTWTVEESYIACERHLMNVHDVPREVAENTRRKKEKRSISEKAS